MSMFPIEHRSALGSKPPILSTDVTLTALPEGLVLQALSATGSGNVAGIIVAALECDALAVRSMSPGQYFIVGDEIGSPGDPVDILHKLKPHADVVDQSHGRVRIAISGAKAALVLAKGTAVDLDLNVFPVGHATTTLIGHIAVGITRTAELEFELMVLRGFAESLWDELAELSLEYR
ncbi:sarcosine oxidase subunit gamma [Mesorhizobium sp. M4B.F.Ca.ET.215.01.1.1]|uniref:sarcosine oxidase subunit gamma family protein n=1 Tax=unclassified Mesorhizobium TaxID=325217 RepID=UPI000FE509F1|nr:MULTISPECIES: sarcosine oxidase subunit gamma family protein [unclassified Mesorhizobium]RWC82863.1 MAG: sarcosine oxidase subunit gamma [Mesorhizobium sp.]TGQ05177.1 sarcosine oxidase subunit gamma [Mesorhizobium sp. M4B.F.Ca.ET.215.01.1.1]TGQ30483.1 sarcosine oxidase subunit gamma [Mesorhizobium sp. M00.F.Ca.ET.220.01.1.1]TGQ97723.1 sarcosine oxidase subunit gamma [Mesorhizobium sp. M4B.F.Ca.ET.203.01.1.1]TIV38357.1 MAG: sarcosine oxidase subunit gamma [Mesorhizobium sp.]